MRKSPYIDCIHSFTASHLKYQYYIWDDFQFHYNAQHQWHNCLQNPPLKILSDDKMTQLSVTGVSNCLITDACKQYLLDPSLPAVAVSSF